ncbi:U4/U6 small nuclear ribonucleoprotein PRP4-like protein [Chloropicon primus]|nr:U4/U6 small nuclear ribonucleoprotein PRP4-like protein [Chloropicon primus]UPQ97319.1 U4/U6 small nuclear ribonucleoprotein PRP4-like protein [Chloropicon primus]|eukprot:QDZ18106.1 U4/U6 small nuclear ribonucleoprotein PRP4-like protein [Chloropicon primus]
MEGAPIVSTSRQEELIKEFELKRRSKSIVVPTNDGQVRQLLRSLGEPITLFGEREVDRRDRLRGILTGLDAEGKGVATTMEVEEDDDVEEVPVSELFYTEGTVALLEHRRRVAKSSLERASRRVAWANSEEGQGQLNKSRERLTGAAKEVGEDCSEFGDDRPISDCSVSSCGRILCTASWSGTYKTWELDGCKKVSSVGAHSDRITGVALHPRAALGSDSETLQVATACSDAAAKLWSPSGKLLHALEGHTDRLARISFDPLGTSVATASYDKTWRLWDCETGVNLLEQEGHSRQVYCVGFQCDGSLLVSGGLDAIGRVWDLRTGKCIRTLRGHIQGILSADFSPNGHQIATGGEDHTCLVWDLRMGPNKMRQEHLYTIAAHQSLVSKVRYAPDHGAVLLTASYDRKVKLWDSKTFSLLSCLEGHENKVMGADIVPATRSVVSVGYDRTIKVWKMKGDAGEEA